MAALQHAIRTQDYRFHMRRIGQHGNDYITFLRHRLIAVHSVGAARNKLFNSLGNHIVHEQFMPCFQQILRHGAPHYPQPDETDFHRHQPFSNNHCIFHFLICENVFSKLKKQKELLW